MNLRDVYGDKVADEMLTRRITRSKRTNFRIRMVHEGRVRSCCVVGAANLIAARTYGHELENFNAHPGYGKAKMDARYALNGNYLGIAHEDKIEDAMVEWDARSSSAAELENLVHALFKKEN